MKKLLFRLVNAIGRQLKGRGLGLERVTLLRNLYESAYHKVAPEQVTLVTVLNHQMYVNPRDEPLGRSLATQGVYEAYETDLFRSAVKDGMTVIDIGANVGYYTLLAAERVGKTGCVLAFEPDPGNYSLLGKNVELNGYTNVKTHPKAVSDSSGHVTLYVDGTNYGNRSFAKGNIVVDGGAIEAETTSLDEFCATHGNINQIDVLKIDAQGAEGLILKGAMETLRNSTPKIFMEFEPGMLRNIGTDPLALLCDFERLGYDCRLIDYETKTLIKLDPSQLLDRCLKNGYVDLYLEVSH